MSPFAGPLLALMLVAGDPPTTPPDTTARAVVTPAAPDTGGAPADTRGASRPAVIRATLDIEAAGLLDITGLAVDTFGRIYVCDAATHRTLRLDGIGRPAGEFGSLGTDPSQLMRPSGVALLGTFGVAVLDRDNRRVLALDLFGRPLGTLLDLAADDLERRVGRIDATAIASDRGGALALLDRERDRVLLFDFSGRFVRELGGIGTAPGTFRELRGIASAPRGELVCADRGNARLQRLDAGGRVAASWKLAVAAGAGALPLAVDGAGRIAMADETAGTLRVWSAAGTLRHESDGWSHPRALAFGPDGTLLVGGSTPARLTRLTFTAPSAPRGR